MYQHNQHTPNTFLQQNPNHQHKDFIASNNFNNQFGGPTVMSSNAQMQSTPPYTASSHNMQQQQNFNPSKTQYVNQNPPQLIPSQQQFPEPESFNPSSVDIFENDKIVENEIENGLSHEELDIHTINIPLSKTMLLSEFLENGTSTWTISSDALKNKYFIHQIKDTDKAFISQKVDDKILNTNYENIFIIDIKIQNAINTFPFSLSVIAFQNVDGKEGPEKIYLTSFNQSTTNDHKRKCMVTIPYCVSVIPSFYAVLDSEKVYASNLFKYFGHTDLNYFLDNHIVINPMQRNNTLTEIYVKQNSQINRMISDNLEMLKHRFNKWDGKIGTQKIDGKVLYVYPVNVASYILKKYRERIDSRINYKRLNVNHDLNFELTYDDSDMLFTSGAKKDLTATNKSSRLVTIFLVLKIRFVFPKNRDNQEKKGGLFSTNFAQEFKKLLLEDK